MTQRGDAQDSPGTAADLELLKLILRDIISRLEDRKLSLDQEIRNYPAPIPQCDAQFNYLLEQRTRLSQQLSPLKAACRESLAINDYADLIIAFIRELEQVQQA